MRSIVFEGSTWNKYEEIRHQNKVLHKNLHKILKEMQRDDPAVGLGKPEPLKHSLSGFWSRRLSQKDRVVYTFDDAAIQVFAIGGHYEKL